MIGERTNVTGSARFARLIRAGQYGEAARVAVDQVRGGANLIDVNMDEGMLDSEQAMSEFLKYIATEPEIARVPFMIDSSKWSVILAGLKCVQGKPVVNSISLKEGEEDFLQKAALVRRYGAGVVVMAFDEKGQADTVERKVSICQRAYRLLTERAGFDPSDIIFDPNILAIATGLEEHNAYAINFIEATSIIKATCPGVKVSGGVSNLSFSFRGNDIVREAMHSAFLYHAIKAGLDMGIVNAGQLVVYEDIPKNLLEHVEDVIFNRRPDATERLVEFAATVKGDGTKREHDLTLAGGAGAAAAVARARPRLHRLHRSRRRGSARAVSASARRHRRSADGRHEGRRRFVRRGKDVPAPGGQERAGDEDGGGVPAAVHGAGEAGTAGSAGSGQGGKGRKGRRGWKGRRAAGRAGKGKIVLATVKGDVHDIGKNIVGVVLGCNSYEVVDLGVMVSCDRILQTALDEHADIIGLSGLITPSLDEMVFVAQEMERRHIHLPLLIGGATTSPQHTAVKVAPEYSRTTVHVLDASRVVDVVSSLLSDDRRPAFEQTRIARCSRACAISTAPAASGRCSRTKRPWPTGRKSTGHPRRSRNRRFSAAACWPTCRSASWSRTSTGRFFSPRGSSRAAFRRFSITRSTAAPPANSTTRPARCSIASSPRSGCGRAPSMDSGPAVSEGDDIIVYSDRAALGRADAVQHAAAAGADRGRQAQPVAGRLHCSAVVRSHAGIGRTDYLGAFAVTAGLGADEFARTFEAANDDYSAIMVKAFADRLAEAFAAYLHAKARVESGIRGNARRPSRSSLKPTAASVRDSAIRRVPTTARSSSCSSCWMRPPVGLSLTEHAAMLPAASVSGLYFAHPQARYFTVGRIGDDQVASYARRKGRRPRRSNDGSPPTWLTNPLAVRRAFTRRVTLV